MANDSESQPLMADVERRDSDDSAAGADRPGAASQDRAASDAQPVPDSSTDHPDAPLETTNGNPDRPAANRGTSTLHVQDENSSDNGSGTSTPRFLQDENSWKRWRWVPYGVRRAAKKIAQWSHGPPNAQPYRIKPIFPAVQEFPLRLVDRFLPGKKRRFWFLFFYFSVWLITFVLVKRQGTLTTDIAGWGAPRSIGCGATYWGSDNTCGLDGNNCRPFNNTGFPFRCSGNCASYHVLNPRAVGDQEIIYRSFVVGGPGSGEDDQQTLYRGDSFICGAAIHAGVIDNAGGGCGVVELVGEQEVFASSNRNGINSVGFDSYFPLSYRFLPDIECHSQDMRWALLAITAVFTGLLSIFTNSAALFFFTNFIGLFWTVGMAMDTPSHRNVADLFSNVLGKFLPAMFCAWVMYDKMGVRRTLHGLTAQFEKTILWLGPCWVGALDNYTLSFIPIQRLTGHDLEQQPGAKAALAIIVIILVAIVAAQVWFFRQEARFLKYIKLYALFIGGIVIALLLPGLDLRIHHYILALLLLPGTSLQMRASLIYQGLLIGLFINGIARWGFDSVLQTPAALQGDAQLGTELPVIPTPTIALGNSTGEASNITFTWEPPTVTQFDGISILVNDVERFRSYFEDSVGQQEDSFVWHRDDDLDFPEYFRFAFMDGSESGDYTKAGVWTAEGEWVNMKPGPSRVKARDLTVMDKVKGRH